MKKILLSLMSVALSTSMMAQQPGPGRPGEGPKPGMKPGKPGKQKKEKKVQEESGVQYVEAGRMYAYGVAMSMNDSTAYVTDQLILENTQTMQKTNFLVGRGELSSQLQRHIEAKGQDATFAAVVYDKKMAKLNKTYQKQVEKLKKQGFVVKTVDQTEFRFNYVREE